MTCSFFGHGDVPGDMLPRITSVVETLIGDGVRFFFVGNRGSFARAVLQILRDMKIVYPEIFYCVVLPYMLLEPEPDACYFPDETLFPPEREGVHPRYAVSCRDDYMLREAETVVCFIDCPQSRAACYAVAAARSGKRVINLKAVKTAKTAANA